MIRCTKACTNKAFNLNYFSSFNSSLFFFFFAMGKVSLGLVFVSCYCLLTWVCLKRPLHNIQLYNAMNAADMQTKPDWRLVYKEKLSHYFEINNCIWKNTSADLRASRNQCYKLLSILCVRMFIA